MKGIQRTLDGGYARTRRVPSRRFCVFWDVRNGIRLEPAQPLFHQPCCLLTLRRIHMPLHPIFCDGEEGGPQARPFLIASAKSADIVSSVPMTIQKLNIRGLSGGLFGDCALHGFATILTLAVVLDRIKVEKAILCCSVTRW